MLVLSRKYGEAIVIGESVVVTVLDVQGGRVKLGVVAPGDVPILRTEVQRKIAHCQPPSVYAEAALADAQNLSFLTTF